MKATNSKGRDAETLNQAIEVTIFLSLLIEKQSQEIRKLRTEKKELNGLLQLALDMVKSGSNGLN